MDIYGDDEVVTDELCLLRELIRLLVVLIVLMLLMLCRTSSTSISNIVLFRNQAKLGLLLNRL